MRFIKYIIRTKRFQKAWEMLFTLCLYGMNKGPINIAISGEEYLIKKLASEFPKDPIIFDVGANKGLYIEALLRHVPESARIHAFEPSSTAFASLQKLPLPNNVHLEQCGFSDEKKTTVLYSDHDGSALASLYQRWKFDFRSEPVELKRIDDYCRTKKIEKIDLLKLDVEGHELFVLKGCGEFLHPEKIKIIQFEFGGVNLDSRTFLRDFFDLLTPRYKLFRMVADGLMPLDRYREQYEIFCATSTFVAKAA
jgi:FkbM family methyltransferase